jgi:SAM domain (Sterile alpha motif)
MDVADWLRKLGLAQYEPAFRENEIDDRVLPSLTAEDLRDLGITLVGIAGGCSTRSLRSAPPRPP